MNRDYRIYRRSTLLQLSEPHTSEEWREIIDSLEVVDPPGGKDDRFQLVFREALHIPACSFVSRTDDDVWFIDTGVEFDGGRMYIGEKDFKGLASVAGYFAKSAASRVYEENERLRTELDLAKHLIGDLRSSIASLVGATPMEKSQTGPNRQRTASTELLSLGDDEDSSDLDLDQV